jgi:hypothetical protein
MDESVPADNVRDQISAADLERVSGAIIDVWHECERVFRSIGINHAMQQAPESAAIERVPALQETCAALRSETACLSTFRRAHVDRYPHAPALQAISASYHDLIVSKADSFLSEMRVRWSDFAVSAMLENEAITLERDVTDLLAMSFIVTTFRETFDQSDQLVSEARLEALHAENLLMRATEATAPTKTVVREEKIAAQTLRDQKQADRDTWLLLLWQDGKHTKAQLVKELKAIAKDKEWIELGAEGVTAAINRQAAIERVKPRKGKGGRKPRHRKK